MGSRGPVGKRSDQRHGHRTESEKALTEKVEVFGVVEPPDADPEWHEKARSLFESLRGSGQSGFYEPSDWQYARVLCQLLSDEFERGNGPRAVMVQTIMSGLSSLLVTEGDRRRVRLELERDQDVPEDAAVAALDDYRSRVSG